jgi:hypothetical protein
MPGLLLNRPALLARTCRSKVGAQLANGLLHQEALNISSLNIVLKLTMQEDSPSTGKPRLSLTAMAGAVCAVFFVAVMLWWLVDPDLSDDWFSAPSRWQGHFDRYIRPSAFARCGIFGVRPAGGVAWPWRFLTVCFCRCSEWTSWIDTRPENHWCHIQYVE